ncbi:hypothetical protein JB92DRAFT_2959612 [Gautieria morchelliformis]|nr:hypothetical protein JB92DRAFT_2959612 [Gautieria morchelliformis]
MCRMTTIRASCLPRLRVQPYSRRGIEPLPIDRGHSRGYTKMSFRSHVRTCGILWCGSLAGAGCRLCRSALGAAVETRRWEAVRRVMVVSNMNDLVPLLCFVPGIPR